MPNIRTPRLGLTRIRASGAQARQLQHIDENFDIVDSSFMSPAGLVESIPRWAANGGNIASLVSQQIKVQLINLPEGMTVTNIIWVSGDTPAGTPTNYWFALYNAQTKVLLGQTADQLTAAWAANTTKTLALQTPYVTPYAGLYYVGIMVKATTPPTLYGAQHRSANLNAMPPIFNGNADSGLTTTAPATLGTISADTMTNWCAVS